MREWFYRLIGRPYFYFMGEFYDGVIWKKVPDPSDMPPIGWRPPGNDWNNWQQDMMVRRKKK